MILGRVKISNHTNVQFFMNWKYHFLIFFIGKPQKSPIQRINLEPSCRNRWVCLLNKLIVLKTAWFHNLCSVLFCFLTASKKTVLEPVWMKQHTNKIVSNIKYDHICASLYNCILGRVFVTSTQLGFLGAIHKLCWQDPWPYLVNILY